MVSWKSLMGIFVETVARAKGYTLAAGFRIAVPGSKSSFSWGTPAHSSHRSQSQWEDPPGWSNWIKSWPQRNSYCHPHAVDMYRLSTCAWTYSSALPWTCGSWAGWRWLTWYCWGVLWELRSAGLTVIFSTEHVYSTLLSDIAYCLKTRYHGSFRN